MNFKGWVWFFAVCLFLLSVRVTPGQGNTADVVGTVTDTSGGVLPNATVTITNTGTSISQTIKSGATGDYTFTLLQVGTYTVTVTANGFKTFTAPNIVLASGDRARVDAPMQVGQASQTVEVSGSVAPALQTDSSYVGSLVNSTAVEDVPLNGRNITRLIQLAPGVTEGSPSSIASGTHSNDRRQTSAFAVNGQSDTANENMIDGLDNNERAVGTVEVHPSIDAIQEINISTNLYTAEVGRTGGGVVDIITKSGTNSLHGSAYEFFRNKVLNASPNWFAPTQANPPYRQNQYGASLGGPIKKNKTFVFGDYEQYDTALGEPVVDTVPTAFEEANPGNFLDIPSALSNKGVNYLPVNISGLPNCGPINPASPQPSSLAGTCITQQGLDYFKMYPTPNQTPSNVAQLGGCNDQSITISVCAAQPVNNFAFDPIRTQNSKVFDVRIDQHFSDSNTLFARYSFNNVDTLTPDDYPNVTIAGLTFNPGAGNSNFQSAFSNNSAGPAYARLQALALGYVHVINANAVLNLKFGYVKSKLAQFNINAGRALNNQLGWPCNATECINVTSGVAAQPTLGLMTIVAGTGFGGVVESYTGLGDTMFIPNVQFDNTFQYMGSLSLTRGTQSIKIGLALMRRRVSMQQSGSTAAFGVSSFAGYYTGNPLADMLEGLSEGIARNVEMNSPNYRTWEPSAYIQDDWRTRRWLTLNLGVRYDIFTPYTDTHNGFSNYNPANGLIVSPGLLGNQQATKTDDVQTNYLDIAPRFGFAASLPHNIVFRGGFGFSYFPTNYLSQYYEKNAPFLFTPSCTEVINSGQTSCATLASTDPSGNFTNPITPPKANLPSGSAGNGAGGAWLPLGMPTPVLNPALATNTALYASQGTVDAIPFNFPDGYLEQGNLLIQKEWKGNVATIGWVGEFGHHAGSAINLNSYANYQEQNTKILPLVAEGFPWWTGSNVQEEGNYASSAYNALQTSLQRRFSRGLTLNFSYTWAHDLSTSQACTPHVTLGLDYPCFYDIPGQTTFSGGVVSGQDQVASNQKYGWGNNSFDVTDRFTWTANYVVPYGASLKGFEAALLRGWALNTAGSWQTGMPFGVSLGGSDEAVSLDGYRSATPDQVGSGKLSHPTLAEWFNTTTGPIGTPGAAFVTQTEGTIGDERPSPLFGPRLWRVDFSIFKDFQLTERVKLQFRTEVFNLFNDPEFANPGATLGNPGAGQVTALSTNSAPRQIQFAVKFTF